jgi:hypothetical protein
MPPQQCLFETVDQYLFGLPHKHDSAIPLIGYIEREAETLFVYPKMNDRSVAFVVSVTDVIGDPTPLEQPEFLKQELPHTVIPDTKKAVISKLGASNKQSRELEQLGTLLHPVMINLATLKRKPRFALPMHAVQMTRGSTITLVENGKERSLTLAPDPSRKPTQITTHSGGHTRCLGTLEFQCGTGDFVGYCLGLWECPRAEQSRG